MVAPYQAGAGHQAKPFRVESEGTLTPTPWSGFCGRPPFTEEETEPWAQGPVVRKWLYSSWIPAYLACVFSSCASILGSVHELRGSKDSHEQPTAFMRLPPY